MALPAASDLGPGRTVKAESSHPESPNKKVPKNEDVVEEGLDAGKHPSQIALYRVPICHSRNCRSAGKHESEAVEMMTFIMR